MQIFGFDISMKRLRPAEEAEERTTACAPKSSDMIWDDDGLRSKAGVSVSVERALSVPGVWAAVKTISETLASLPFGIYQRTEEGSKLATNHSIYNLLTLEPSELYSAYDFRRALFAKACFGNAFARIYRNGVGRPIELRIINDAKVTPFLTKEGTLRYMLEPNNNAVREVLLPMEVLHIKGFTLDGIAGADVIRTHRETMGMAIAANEWGGAFFGNGAHLGGIIEYAGSLDKEQEKRLYSRFNRNAVGPSNVGKWKVLDAGMKATPHQLDPEKAMLNETRTFQVDESARIFGIPAHLVGQLDRATFNNIETMNVQFVTLSLRPWAVQVEQEFTRKLLSTREKATGNYFMRMNLDGLLRGDTKSRAAYYNTLFNIGAMSPNDVRELENLNRRKGGDEYFTPLNMVGNESEETDEESQTDDEAQTQTNEDEQGEPQQ